MKNKVISTINQASIFQTLSLDEKKEMLPYSQWQEYHENDVIFKVDSQDCDSFYIIHSGIIGLRLKDGRTKEYYSGDIFGEVAVFNKGYRSGTIYAKTDARLVAVHRNLLMGEEVKNPLMRAKLTNALTNQIISYLEEVQERPSAEIIAAGENTQVEFKSSITKHNETKILKTIVGFLNNEGGTIFIGVRDTDGDVLGVHHNDKEIDQFRTAFMSKVCRQIGDSFATLIKCHTEYVYMRKIIKIVCLPAARPAFYRTYKAQGTLKTEEFIVRQDAMNSTLTSKSDIADYVLKRFSIK